MELSHSPLVWYLQHLVLLLLLPLPQPQQEGLVVAQAVLAALVAPAVAVPGIKAIVIKNITNP